MPGLPQGFVLDQQSNASSLPQGFVLDQDAPNPVVSGETKSLTKGERPTLASMKQAFDDASTAVGSGIPFADEIVSAAGAPLIAATNYVRDTPNSGSGVMGRLSTAYDQLHHAAMERERKAFERSPVASTVGSVLSGAATGGTAAKGGLSFLNAAKPTLRSMVGRGAAEGATYGALYGAGEGEGLKDRLFRGVGGAVTGGVTGGALPLATAGTGKAAGFFGKKAAGLGRTLLSPEREAQARVASALQRDASLGQGGLTPQELVAAQGQGQPATVMDMGGEATRDLARVAANISPEGRATLNRSIDNRFEEQGSRIGGFLRKLVGGTDASTKREALLEQARRANDPAYRKAYSQPEAQAIWDEGLEQLSTAPVVQDAIRMATVTARNRNALSGMAPIKSPFVVDKATGRVALGTDAQGNRVLPNLEFWDHVKRNLDAINTGESRAASRALRGHLDQLVPAYGEARSGAAKFFGAGDALEAGQRFVSATVDIPEAKRALAKMSAPERTLFREGFVSDLIDKINRTRDRVNVVNKIYGSKDAQDRIAVALGPQKAKELEAFLRAESLMDLARGAVQGNSTTARQWAQMALTMGGPTRKLLEMGVAGGAYGAYTGDPKDILFGALAWGASRGGAAGLAAADQKVMRAVAEKLVSSDPQVYRQAIQRISMSPKLMNAIRQAATVAGSQAAANRPASTNGGPMPALPPPPPPSLGIVQPAQAAQTNPSGPVQADPDYDPVDLRKKIEGMSPDELNNFRVDYVNEIERIIKSDVDPAGLVKRIWSDPKIVKKFEVVLGPELAEKLKQQALMATLTSAE